MRSQYTLSLGLGGSATRGNSENEFTLLVSNTETPRIEPHEISELDMFLYKPYILLLKISYTRLDYFCLSKKHTVNLCKSCIWYVSVKTSVVSNVGIE